MTFVGDCITWLYLVLRHMPQHKLFSKVLIMETD